MTEISIQLKNSTPTTRTFFIDVPAKVVNERYQNALAQIQKDAQIKGFRKGHVPPAILKQNYGAEIEHRLYHILTEEMVEKAVDEQKVRMIGHPRIEKSSGQFGEDEHDHGVKEDKNFSFEATVDILPEIPVKNYSGLKVKRPEIAVKDEQIEEVLSRYQEQNSELVPVSGGLLGADGNPTGGRAVQKGDFVDIEFDGGLVTENGVEKLKEMKGRTNLEIGSQSFIPGFEEEVIGVSNGGKKTFKIRFPEDYGEKRFANAEAEFEITVHGIKEKKKPELNDEFAKTLGFDDLGALKEQTRSLLIQEENRKAESKIENDLVGQLIEQTPFDVPQSLIESQTRIIAQEFAEDLKSRGIKDQKFLNEAITQRLDDMKKRAEKQVRASLILQKIAELEKIQIEADEVEAEIKEMSNDMRVEVGQIQEFYAKNPSRKADLYFRLRQQKTLKNLIAQAKIS